MNMTNEWYVFKQLPIWMGVLHHPVIKQYIARAAPVKAKNPDICWSGFM